MSTLNNLENLDIKIVEQRFAKSICRIFSKINSHKDPVNKRFSYGVVSLQKMSQLLRAKQKKQSPAQQQRSDFFPVTAVHRR